MKQNVISQIKEGFFKGVGWAFGVTVGFVLISTILVSLFKKAGGLPIVGDFIADVVESTQEQLQKRTPVFK